MLPPGIFPLLNMWGKLSLQRGFGRGSFAPDRKILKVCSSEYAGAPLTTKTLAQPLNNLAQDNKEAARQRP